MFDKQWIKQNTPRDKAKIAIYSLSFSLAAVLAWFFLIQPVFFPKFVKFQTLTWQDEDVYYIEKNQIEIDVGMPSQDIVKITKDGKNIPLEQQDKELKKGSGIRISFDNLKIGENRYEVIKN